MPLHCVPCENDVSKVCVSMYKHVSAPRSVQYLIFPAVRSKPIINKFLPTQFCSFDSSDHLDRSIGVLTIGTKLIIVPYCCCCCYSSTSAWLYANPSIRMSAIIGSHRVLKSKYLHVLLYHECFCKYQKNLHFYIMAHFVVFLPHKISC